MHLFVMLRLVYTKLRKLKKLPNGGSLVSFIITTLNLNVSLRLYLKLNLKLNLNLSLNLNLNLKLNVSLKFNLKLIFFSGCVFLHEHLRFIGQYGKRKIISFIFFYHFHLLAKCRCELFAIIAQLMSKSNISSWWVIHLARQYQSKLFKTCF